ncbi:MAG: MBL fold metallo-hydrolase [Bacteroidia bacterium]|nr:MBL fold metallo-hydrolase [Bacteroidia bacterium]
MRKLLRYSFLALVFLGLLSGILLYNNPYILLDPFIERQAGSSPFRSELLAEEEGIRIITIGTAAPLPSERAQNSTAVFVNGHFFVFDVGVGAVANMERFGLPLNELDGVFISHWHSDHFLDLPYLLNRSWQFGRKGELACYGPTGIDSIFKGIESFLHLENKYRIAHHGPETMDPASALGKPLEIDTEGKDSKVIYEEAGIKITAILVDHAPIDPAYAFKIEYAGKSVLISGDTKSNENLKKHAEGVDILIHEVLHMEMIQKIGKAVEESGNERNAKILQDVLDYHTSPAEVAKLAQEAAVKKLIFSHMGPAPDLWLMKRAYEKSVDGLFEGPIVFANDGDEFFIP